jgi:hypothetical protein
MSVPTRPDGTPVSAEVEAAYWKAQTLKAVAAMNGIDADRIQAIPVTIAQSVQPADRLAEPFDGVEVDQMQFSMHGVGSPGCPSQNSHVSSNQPDQPAPVASRIAPEEDDGKKKKRSSGNAFLSKLFGDKWRLVQARLTHLLDLV